MATGEKAAKQGFFAKLPATDVIFCDWSMIEKTFDKMKKLLVSPSPHIHGKENTKSLMRDVVIALLPTVAVSIYCFGLSALKLALVGVLACVAIEYVIAKFVLKGLR